MKTLVIIPTYNERDNLEAVVRGVLAAGDAFHVLVVDDASPDGTGALADALAQEHPARVFALHRAGKQGLGSAYLAGFAFGIERGFEAVCEMDADGSHQPEALPQLHRAVIEGADTSIGSRRIKGGKVIGWGPHRHLMSGGAMALSRWALGLRARDVTSGFRCYRADTVRHLLAQDIKGSGYAFQEETLFLVERAGYKVAEVPIIFRDRQLGTSKLSWRDVVQFFQTIWRLRAKR